MDLEFFGANCFRIKTKATTVVVDDNMAACGGKTVVKDDAVLLQTSSVVHDDKAEKNARLILSEPGEFEVGDISVVGLQVRGHMDTEDQKTATVFQFIHSNMTITFLGHIHPDISNELVELAGGTDVLVVPVGGHGYTLDSVGAVSLVKKIEPNVVVPSQYDIEGLNYEVGATRLDEFVKASGMQADEPVDVLKLGKDSESDSTRIVVIRPKV